MIRRYLPYLQLLFAALLFSTGGAAIKATSLSSWQVAGFRSGIAALALWVFSRKALQQINRKTILVGISYAATLTLFVLANKLTTSANTIFLQSTAPLYILLLSPWLLKETIKKSDLIFMAVVASGLILFFVSKEQPVATAPNPFQGNLLAVIAGIFWAFTIMGLRWMGQEEDGANSPVIIGNVFAFLICLPFVFPLAHTTWIDWASLAYLGLFQIALAYVFMLRALKHLQAFEASIILLVEPAFNPLWTWLLHREEPGLLPSIGGSLILGATLVKTWKETRKKKTLKETTPKN